MRGAGLLTLSDSVHPVLYLAGWGTQGCTGVHRHLESWELPQMRESRTERQEAREPLALTPVVCSAPLTPDRVFLCKAGNGASQSAPWGLKSLCGSASVPEGTLLPERFV